MEPKTKKNNKVQNQLRIKELTPLTTNQSAFFNAWEKYKVHSLTGWPGTGKTYIALYKAFEEMELDDTIFNVKIIRSAVPSREIGYLPGTSKDKMSAYEVPYISLINKLYGRGDAYDIQRQKGKVEFISTSFLRGQTLDNCVVIIDEGQNLDDGELFTILTRIGEKCKVIICGDVNQDDLSSERFKTKSGYGKILTILESMSSVHSVEFGIDDIVRSDWIKELIIQYMRYKDEPEKRLLLNESLKKLDLVA